MFLAGAALENVTSSEVEEAGADIPVEAGVDELQRGATDAESLSSGSSIELLDISDEVQDHVTAESPADESNSSEKLVEAARDEDREDEEEMIGEADHSADAAGSESSTSEEGQIVVVEPEVNSSQDTVATAPSVDEEGSEELVAETDVCDESHESLPEVKLQQSTLTSSATDTTVMSELQDNILGDVARSDIFTSSILLLCLQLILNLQNMLICYRVIL